MAQQSMCKDIQDIQDITNFSAAKGGLIFGYGCVYKAHGIQNERRYFLIKSSVVQIAIL
jgi:hypothetical protein